MPYFPKFRVKCALFGEAPLYFEKLAGALQVTWLKIEIIMLKQTTNSGNYGDN